MENNFEIDKTNACNTEIKSPLFSIITINRNNAEGLRKTMQSIFSQDFSDYEYIIIDGASTDESVDVIREFLAVPEYVEKISYWVSEPDSGIYNAMNKGIRHATGEFVNMMNSGDTMLPEVLGRVAKIAREHKGEVLYGAVSCIKDGQLDFVFGNGVKNILHSAISHQSCFISADLHKNHGFYDESYNIVADWDLLIKFYLEKVQFFYMDMIVADFDYGGISNTSPELLQSENAIVRKKYNLHKGAKYFKLKNIVKLLFPGWVILLLKKINFLRGF